MKLVPRSLGGRLLSAAGLFAAVALIIAGLAIQNVLDRFVHAQLDQRLDGQIAAIAAAIGRADEGYLRLTTDVDVAPFNRPRSGWYWLAKSGSHTLASRSLEDRDSLSMRIPPRPPRHRGRSWPGKGQGPDGEPLHLRIFDHEIGPETIRIIAAAPQAALDEPLRGTMLPIFVSLAVIGTALMAAVCLQVWLGLLPLQRLSRALAAVRNGTLSRIQSEQPAEIQPLVAELNSLLEQNEDRLTRARRHLANLAHGLKTPLATMALALRESNPDRQRMSHLVENMDRLIRHHLARARTAAQAGGTRARADLAERLNELVATLTQIHSDKDVAAHIQAPRQLFVAAESQDLDELLGNLLDNAFRFSTAAVKITVLETTTEARIHIDDDGPGLSPTAMVEALRPGERLDESAPGYGFGLTIAREIVELYGGEFNLAASPSGGLRVSLALPLAR